MNFILARKAAVNYFNAPYANTNLSFIPFVEKTIILTAKTATIRRVV
jgi:hypothetical protein